MNSSVIHIPITETPSMVSTNIHQWNSQNEPLDLISCAISSAGGNHPNSFSTTLTLPRRASNIKGPCCICFIWVSFLFILWKNKNYIKNCWSFLVKRIYTVSTAGNMTFDRKSELWISRFWNANQEFIGRCTNFELCVTMSTKWCQAKKIRFG